MKLKMMDKLYIEVKVVKVVKLKMIAKLFSKMKVVKL